jgi:hypothetical protein
MRKLPPLILLPGGLIVAGHTPASAQIQLSFAQVVALDEWDPVTFQRIDRGGTRLLQESSANRSDHHVREWST